jgi:hypothetical protein
MTDPVLSTYRYTLRRKTRVPLRWVKKMLFIMLNPSTADDFKDDPTIRRCIGFAEREGCTDLMVVNLFALRATDPRELLKSLDPFGPSNDEHLEAAIREHRNEIIVAAWGANKLARVQGELVTKKYGPFKCLGITKGGAPKHPLYVPANAPLVDYCHG